MNILFFLRSLNVGGVEKVTAVLANEFSKIHNVYVLYNGQEDELMKNSFNKSIRLIKYEDSLFGIYKKLKELLGEKHIDILINQWGIQFYYVLVFSFLLKNKAKIISVYHNKPGWNGMISNAEKRYKQAQTFLQKFLCGAKYNIVQAIVRQSTNVTYALSDKYVVLSESYVEVFKDFCRRKDAKKLKVIPNPITIESVAENVNKKNILLYVGRLDYEQKCVDRLIDVWKSICSENDTWDFNIIGDGPARKDIEKEIGDKGLKRINVLGYKDPSSYYAEAKILCLVSEAEGFPLVVCEAMNNYVVPIIYDSFEAVKDLIPSSKCGCIVEKKSGSFSIELYSEKLKELMNKDISDMAKEANRASERYTLLEINKKWDEIFQE